MADLVRDIPAVEEKPEHGRRRLFVPSLYLFRGVAAVHAVLAVTQAVSIGQYLDGRYGLLRVHQVTAGLLVLAGMVLGLVAVGHVLSGGRWWAGACVILFLAEGVQTGLGYSRSLGVHVPLGVAIVTLSLVVAVLSWTPAAGRPRSRRAPVPGAGA
jgi:hypothetical protein